MAARWTPAPKGQFAKIDWSRSGAGAPLSHCDPYLAWFDLTNRPGTGMKDQKPGGTLQPKTWMIGLLLELPDDQGARKKSAEKLLRLGFLPNFIQSIHGNRMVRRYVSGRLPWQLLDEFFGAYASGELGVVRFELSMPRQGESVNSELTNYKNLGLLNLVLQSENKRKTTQSKLPPVSKHPARQLIVVIDDECNPDSRNLRTPDGARLIHSIWHQGKVDPPPAGGGQASRPQNGAARTPWDYDRAPPVTGGPGFSPGRPQPDPPVLGQETYGATHQVHRSGADGLHYHEHDETRICRELDYPKVLRQWTHGSAVLSLIAEQRTFRHGAWHDLGEIGTCSPEVHFVQLPSRGVLDTAGGSLAVHALDAVHRAIRLAHPNEPPGDKQTNDFVIVNLSYGTHSGPHDGTSMLECAIDELLALHDGSNGLPQLHVVLPAGNSHLLRCHAAGWLDTTTQDKPREIHWKVLPDDPTDSYLEIWLSQGGEVELQVEGPGVPASDWISPGTAFVCALGEGALKATAAALIYPKVAAQGKNGTMALLALGPTQRRADNGVDDSGTNSTLGVFDTLSTADDRLKALENGPKRVPLRSPDGVWTVRLRVKPGQPAACFDTYVQRDDAAPGRTRSSIGYKGRQSYLLESPEGNVDARCTLNGIATGYRPGQLWVVGAMSEDGRISRYSSAGPARLVNQRFDGPDVVLKVDQSRNRPGRLIGGLLTGARVRLPGTSFAAAAFTRVLYQTLSSGKGTQHLADPMPDHDYPRDDPEIEGEPAPASPYLRGLMRRL